MISILGDGTRGLQIPATVLTSMSVSSVSGAERCVVREGDGFSGRVSTTQIPDWGRWSGALLHLRQAEPCH